MLILIVAAWHVPVSVDRGGRRAIHDASILQTALTFSGNLTLLSVAVLFFIVVIPAIRLSLLIYVLAPIIRDKPPAPLARKAFALSEALVPWSMA